MVPFDSINYDAGYQVPFSIPDPAKSGEKKKTKAEKEDVTEVRKSNLDIHQEASPAVASIQGSISTTKSGDLKRTSSNAEKQLNQKLIMKREASFEESTIVQKPSDKPINLDMNSFLGDTQKTRKDIDIINDVKNI